MAIDFHKKSITMHNTTTINPTETTGSSSWLAHGDVDSRSIKMHTLYVQADA